MSSSSASSSASSTSSNQNVPLPKNAQELEQVFSAFLQGDNIKQAEAILKAFVKKADCVGALMQQLVSSNQPQVRQMAGVLLRGRLNTHWRKLNTQVHNQIKVALLQRLRAESYRPSRLAIAALISSIAKHLLPANQWPELLGELVNFSRSTETGQREIAMLLFRALADNVGKALRPYLVGLIPTFKAALGDSSEVVKIEALKAINMCVELVETKEQTEVFQDAIPAIGAVVQQFISSGKQEAACIAFELWEAIADSPQNILEQHLTAVMKLMLQIVTATKLDLQIRENASGFIASMVENKPRKLLNAKLLEPILQAAFALLIENYPDPIDAQDMTPQKLGAEILYAVFEHMPNRQSLCQMCLSNISKLLTSKNELERKGAFIALACLCEEYDDQLEPHLENLIQAVCSGIVDASVMVRTAACVALSEIADNCEDVTRYHQKVIPRVLSPLENAQESLNVKKKACLALEMFCQLMEPTEVRPYVDALMKSLLNTLTIKDDALQEYALAAIKAVAVAAESTFLPYFQATVKLVVPLMENKDEDYLKLRVRATELAGALAVAVGKDQFRNYVDGFYKLAKDGMEMDYFDLREAGYKFFANLADCLGKDICPRAQEILTYLYATLESDDGILISSPNNDLEQKDPIGAEADEEDAEEDEQALLNGERQMNIAIRSGALDEKVEALACLKSLVEQMESGFLAYTEKTLKVLDEVSEYGHPNIRVQVIHVYGAILQLYDKCFPNPTQWTAGVLVKMHPNTQKIVEPILSNLYDRMHDDESKEVVALSCENIIDVCKLFGPAGIQTKLEVIMKQLHVLLNGKSRCQVKSGDDEVTENDEKSYDVVLCDSIMDLVSQLAMVIGPKFEPAFKNYLPLLLKYCGSDRTPQDRAAAIGALAEIAHELGPAITNYYQQLFPVVFGALAETNKEHTNPLVKRNAAFCLGALCESGGTAAVPYYEKTMALMQRLFDQSEMKELKTKDPAYDFYGARDNAVSAICKMIKNAPTALPLDKVIPVLVQSCPIKADYQEVKNVYLTLMNLFKSHFQLMSPHMGAMISICRDALADVAVPDDLKATMVEFSRALLKQCGSQLNSTLQSWSQPDREAFLKRLA